jgi:hypothetical protein
MYKDPVIDKEPVMLWLPVKLFEPVVANIVLLKPFNKLELLETELLKAYDELVEVRE